MQRSMCWITRSGLPNLHRVEIFHQIKLSNYLENPQKILDFRFILINFQIPIAWQPRKNQIKKNQMHQGNIYL